MHLAARSGDASFLEQGIEGDKQVQVQSLEIHAGSEWIYGMDTCYLNDPFYKCNFRFYRGAG